MSIREQIETLEALAVVDADLKRVDEAIAQERAALAGMKSELKKLDEKLVADKASLAGMEKLRSDLVTEVRQMSTQIERSREKLSRSRNEREANAAQRELEELRKLLRDREDELGKLQTLADQARGSIDETEAARSKISGELDGSESDINARLVASTAEREQKLAERTTIATKLPSMTLRRYDQVRQKRGTGIARAVDGTCLACHVSLPAMFYQKLTRGEAFEQCPSCGRVLYFKILPPPSA